MTLWQGRCMYRGPTPNHQTSNAANRQVLDFLADRLSEEQLWTIVSQ